MLAADNGHTEAVLSLLVAGADTNAKDAQVRDWGLRRQRWCTSRGKSIAGVLVCSVTQSVFLFVIYRTIAHSLSNAHVVRPSHLP